MTGTGPQGHDGLDVAAVNRWLAQKGIGDGDLQARLLAGGRSNLTFVLSDDSRRMILRRPPLGDVLRGAHDVAREYRILAALQTSAVPVPPVLALCEDDDVIGAPFSVVACVEGLTLRTPEDLAGLTPAGRERLMSDFAGTLATLHAVDPMVTGMAPDRGRQYVERQIHVWRRQLTADPTRDLPQLDALADRLLHTIPPQQTVSIVHRDYRLDNVLISPDGTTLAVLDWELWTLGDPLADLAAAIVYWCDTPWELLPLGTSPTVNGALGSRDDLIASYIAAGGSPVDEAQLAWVRRLRPLAVRRHPRRRQPTQPGPRIRGWRRSRLAALPVRRTRPRRHRRTTPEPLGSRYASHPSLQGAVDVTPVNDVTDGHPAPNPLRGAAA